MNKVILIAAAVLLTGCGKSDEQERLTPVIAAPPAKDNVVVVAETGRIMVYLVTLPDGSRCAVEYRGGLDCDWAVVPR